MDFIPTALANLTALALSNALTGIYHGVRDTRNGIVIIDVDNDPHLSTALYNALHDQFSGRNRKTCPNPDINEYWKEYVWSAQTVLKEKGQFSARDPQSRDYILNVVSLSMRYLYHMWKTFPEFTDNPAFKTTMMQACQTQIFTPFKNVDWEEKRTREFIHSNFTFFRFGPTIGLQFCFRPLDAMNDVDNKNVTLNVTILDLDGIKELHLEIVDSMGVRVPMMRVKENENSMDCSRMA
ncbi:hypothetical protein H0H93_009262 [Arthromyces matolae]|nr:hypothetical protein H0H93_009262 [Arthromyces matolae]